MMTHKVLMVVTDDGRTWEISLGQLFQMVRSGLAETLVFGEAEPDGTVKWEKQFLVMTGEDSLLRRLAEESE